MPVTMTLQLELFGADMLCSAWGVTAFEVCCAQDLEATALQLQAHMPQNDFEPNAINLAAAKMLHQVHLPWVHHQHAVSVGGSVGAGQADHPLQHHSPPRSGGTATEAIAETSLILETHTACLMRVSTSSLRC